MSSIRGKEVLLKYTSAFGSVYTFFTDGTYHGTFPREGELSEWQISEDGYLMFRHCSSDCFTYWDYRATGTSLWKDLPILLVEASIERSLL